jgi:hypothetical protein
MDLLASRRVLFINPWMVPRDSRRAATSLQGGEIVARMKGSDPLFLFVSTTGPNHAESQIMRTRNIGGRWTQLVPSGSISRCSNGCRQSGLTLWNSFTLTSVS